MKKIKKKKPLIKFRRGVEKQVELNRTTHGVEYFEDRVFNVTVHENSVSLAIRGARPSEEEKTATPSRLSSTAVGQGIPYIPPVTITFDSLEAKAVAEYLREAAKEVERIFKRKHSGRSHGWRRAHRRRAAKTNRRRGLDT